MYVCMWKGEGKVGDIARAERKGGEMRRCGAAACAGAMRGGTAELGSGQTRKGGARVKKGEGKRDEGRGDEKRGGREGGTCGIAALGEGFAWSAGRGERGA